jgi:hypothetical protein
MDGGTDCDRYETVVRRVWSTPISCTFGDPVRLLVRRDSAAERVSDLHKSSRIGPSCGVRASSAGINRKERINSAKKIA